MDFGKLKTKLTITFIQDKIFSVTNKIRKKNMDKERFVIFSAKENLAICMHNLPF